MTRSQMEESTLSGVCSLVTDGTHDTPKTLDVGIPLIKAKEIVGGTIDFDNCDRISHADHLKVISRSKPEKGDTLFAHIGASLGEAAYVNTDKEFSIKNIALFKPDPSKIDSRYLYYYVIGPVFQSGMKNVRTGSAQPFLSLGHLRNHPIRYHKQIKIQRKIAAILSAYDDLIENNTRRIKILEEMASALYREWFVNFRFPGHEKVQMEESELGPKPEGWEVVKFTDIADVLSGGTPKTNISEYWNGQIPFFAPKDSPSSFYVLETEKSITELGLKRCNSKLYPRNTVFITARGTVGKIAMPAVNMAMNQSCYALKGRDGISQYFVFLAIKNCIEELKQRATGAVFDTIIVDTFRMLEVVKPPISLINRISDLVTPLFDLILNISYQNANLRRTRDLLLPQLISGKIDIENVKINDLS